MTTLWIDNNMVIRWHPNWPDQLEFVKDTSSGISVEYDLEGYNKALAQAKKESVPVEYANGEPVTNVGGKPDSFFEVNGVVEVEEICTRGSCVHSDAGCYAHVMPGETCSARKVARLKPASSAMSFTDGSELPSAPFPQNPQISAVQGPWSNTEHEYQCHFNLRARILDEFNNITNADNAYQALEWTLDRLNIK